MDKLQSSFIPLHVFINLTCGNIVILKSIPCVTCGASIRPKSSYNQLETTPVLYGLQFAKCPICSAEHFVINARTKADCITLAPALLALIDELRAETNACDFIDVDDSIPKHFC